MELLRTESLTKTFGRSVALDNVSLALNCGELLLLLGPNGAGKTTMSRVITTLARPQKGNIFYRGTKVEERNRGAYRRSIGYLSHRSFIYGHLTARENLLFFGRLYGISEVDSKTTGLLKRVGLASTGRKRVGNFSRGMQQRLSIARVLLTTPSLFILDEPYAGLDPEGHRTFTKLLSTLKTSDSGVILITHDLTDCISLADRVAVLSKGRLVWDGDVGGMDAAEVKERYFAVTGKETYQ